jgi:hypothetical protein
MQSPRCSSRLTSLACLVLAACGHKPIAVPVSAAALTTTDGLPNAENRLELVDHANRLCVTIASREQRNLGYRAAARASALAPDDAALALLTARCAFLTADFETDEAVVVPLTDQGLAAVAKADPTGKEPLAAYYHALLLGMAVRLKGLDALGRLPEVLDALKVAKEKPEVDLGGPLRVLGMLYLNAPAWPAGPGDLEASLDLLKDAVTRYPSHPLNHLYFAEALHENDQRDAARSELTLAKSLARADLWGDANCSRWLEEIAKLETRLVN